MKSDRPLQEIFDQLREKNLIKPNRIGPIRTAIKQYAQILGYEDAAACPSSAFLKTDRVRNRLIDEKAPRSLGTHGVRNLKNNVSFILRTAVSEGMISPHAELASWKDSNSAKRLPKRNEVKHPSKYVIDPVPSSLEQELADYEQWCTKVVNRARPRRMQKRPVSFFHHRVGLLHEAGYLVKFRGLRPESITLLTLIEPNNAIGYVEWYIEQQGRHTSGSVSLISYITGLAKYLEIKVEGSKQKPNIQQWLLEIGKFKASLSTPTKVESKYKRWLSVAQLETVGCSIYPFNARRVQELSPFTRRRVDRLKNQHAANGFQRYAYRVMLSLLIRLVIRIPLRQRNLREMRWAANSLAAGDNLYKKDGVWHLKFRGNDLKIAQVRGEEHVAEFEFPADLVPLLEEWLYKWRPSLIASNNPEDQGKQHLANGQEFVFMGFKGCPLKMHQVTQAFERATYKFTGVAVNPHMFRTIFATEFITETNDFIGAAYMLMDSVEVVIKKYAYLLDKDCGKRANEWISRKLGGPGNDGDAQPRSLPKLNYPRGR
jgi:hypothetical protein